MQQQAAQPAIHVFPEIPLHTYGTYISRIFVILVYSARLQDLRSGTSVSPQLKGLKFQNRPVHEGVPELFAELQISGIELWCADRHVQR